VCHGRHGRRKRWNPGRENPPNPLRVDDILKLSHGFFLFPMKASLPFFRQTHILRWLNYIEGWFGNVWYMRETIYSQITFDIS
jgi:hypothetical protein